MEVLLIPDIYSHLGRDDVFNIARSCKVLRAWLKNEQRDFLWEHLTRLDFPFTEFFDFDCPKKKRTNTKLRRYFELCERYHFWEVPEKGSKERDMKEVVRYACEHDVGTLLAMPVYLWPPERITECLHVVWRVMAVEGWCRKSISQIMGSVVEFCESKILENGEVEFCAWMQRAMIAAYRDGSEMLLDIVHFREGECVFFSGKFWDFVISSVEPNWFFGEISLRKRVLEPLLNLFIAGSNCIWPRYYRLYLPLASAIRELAEKTWGGGNTKILVKIAAEWAYRREYTRGAMDG